MTGYQKTADSDVRMMIATQVAYLDGDKGMSVGELTQRIIHNYGGQTSLSKQQQAQLDTARYIQERIEEFGLQDCNRWVIKEVADSNAQTGFYGCLIDTRDGEAILGFRGSESFDDGQIVNDWLKADFGLLNNPQTTQQQQAEAFTQYVHDTYGDAYQSYNFSGHSLGGNLAEHAAITAPDGMSVHRCVNLDGPGFSDEYIAAHGSQIRQNSGKVDHYQYSAVGELLTPLPGSRHQTIAARDAQDDGLMRYLGRHDTHNIQFDPESGSFQPGTKDPLAMIAGPISLDFERGAPAILWATFPGFALLVTLADAGYTALLEMKDMADNLVKNIKNSLEIIKQSVANWFQSLFGVALTGQFELNISAVNGLGADMDEVSRKLQRIYSSLSELTGQLRYHSLSGACFKSKLRSLSGQVNRDRSKAAALAAAARSCAQYSTQDDMRAAQCYAGIS